MPARLACNACNKELIDVNDQKIHYKSEWHRYNLKRKIAGVFGVTEALFLARQSTLAEEKSKLIEPPMMYACGLCGKGYRSSKAHAQHLKSRAHTTRASQNGHQNEDTAIIKPLPPRFLNKLPRHKEEHDEESDESDEWEEVDQNGDLVDDITSSMNHEEEVDPTCCFMCDQKHKTIEKCMIHMHKHHGFFIPDVEYLKDPTSLLTYLGLKVKRDYICLYCNSNCQPFSSLEAVRKHMVAKSHCRVHYGDGEEEEEEEEEEGELEEFYDYSSSYIDENGKQLVTAADEISTITMGPENICVIIVKNHAHLQTELQVLMCWLQGMNYSNQVSGYRNMGLSTVESKEKMVKMKVMKQMNRSGVEVMRSKIGMKSNIIRNLPSNVTY